MTDTDTEAEGKGEAPADDATSSESTAVEPNEAAPPEKIPFWNRPYVERYLTPLVLPVVVVVGVVFYILNVSRLFLSAHGHVPIIIATVITLIILIGASVLAGADFLRPRQIILMTVGFIIAITFAGWISLGHSASQIEAAGVLPTGLKASQTEQVQAAPGGNLVFSPNAFNAKTGLVNFEVKIDSPGHTFGFHDPSTLFQELKLDTGGATLTGTAFFGAPGEYTFFCSIPGHEAAGMHGTVTVTGPTLTLQQALSQSGNPPNAVKGGT
jgi:plastocyanin